MTSDVSGLVGFWHELRRRRVVRFLAVYVVASWLVLQVVDVVFPMIGVPAWADRLVLALLVVGLVVGLILAWTFDVTPTGVVRTPGADPLGSDVEEAARSDPPSADTGEGGDEPASGNEFSTLAIAVLPFVNLSRDPDNEYFSDGITEDILTQLSRIEDLHVVSRTSVMGYKGTSKQIREIARELEVGSVLEGSVRPVGDGCACRPS